MIKYVLIFCFSLVVFSFTNNKHKKFIPPGTVQITETLYADETEISNLSWLEFEFWTAVKYGKNSKEHLATLPDTLVWRDQLSFNEPYVLYYYRHVAYKDYPVVGISYEQALAFCKWRTERVKEFYSLSYKKELHLDYRLPTKQEWEFLSNNGAGIFSNNGKNEKGHYKVNVARPLSDSIGKKSLINDNADVTAPVFSYWKSQFGLYNMFGNVSEMISEKGISKGGGWRNNLEDCRAGKDIVYTKPTSWLGFRCVCEFKKDN